MTGRFARLEHQLQDLTKPQTRHDLHNLAGREFAKLIDEGFERERDPYGVAWKPSKAAQREGRKTLRDTGALQDGIRWMADSRKLVFKTTGSANKYAAIHQYGGSRTNFHASNGRFISAKRAARRKTVVPISETNLPARPFLPGGTLPRQYEQRLLKVYEQYLHAKFGR